MEILTVYDAALTAERVPSRPFMQAVAICQPGPSKATGGNAKRRFGVPCAVAFIDLSFASLS